MKKVLRFLSETSFRHQPEDQSWLYQNPLFSSLTKVPLIKSKLSELKHIYQSICPYEDKEAEEMALNSFFYAFLSFVGTVLIVFTINLLVAGPTVYAFICPFFAGYYVSTSVLYYRQDKIAECLQNELSAYFQNVSHYYESEKSIINALERGAFPLSKDIQTVANFIIRILTSENAEEKIYTYVTDSDKNLYLKLFIQQCYECFEHGDTIRNGISVFHETLETFRVDMLRTRMEQTEYKMKLNGLSFVIWLPSLSMSIIQKFGLSMMEDMEIFYAKFGLLVECLALAVSFFLYRSLNQSKYQHLKTITIKDIYYKIQAATKWFQGAKPNWLIKGLQSVACNAPASVCYTKMTTDALIGTLFGFIAVFINITQTKSPIQFSHLIVALSCGMICFAFPIKVVILKRQFKKDKEKEIDSIQLLMLSEMHSKTITLADLLAKMEQLSSYYKAAIGQCLTMFTYDQTKALTELKQVAEREHDFSFSSIVDMLMSVDRLGIEKSFEELKINRTLNLDERHMLTRLSSEKKKDFHELVSVLPSLISVGYILVPFVYYTFRDLRSVTGIIEEMNNLF